MPEATDITLAGVGYSVAPGAYKRTGEGVNPRDHSGRTRVLPAAGLLVPTAPDGNAAAVEGGWDGSGVGPAFGAAGVEPWPSAGGLSDAALAANAANNTPDLADNRPFGLVQADRAYVVVGNYVYKSPLSTAASFTGLTQDATLGTGNKGKGIAHYTDDIVIFRGEAADIYKVNTTTGAGSVWRTGEKGSRGMGYQGELLYARDAAGTQHQLQISLTKHNGAANQEKRFLDAPIVAFGQHRGAAIIATRRTLWSLGGQPYPGIPDDAGISGDQSEPPEWTEDPQPLFSHGSWASGDDFAFLLSLRGRLYTWLAGRVASWGGETDEWTAEPLTGTACHGACIAAGWLVLAILARDGASELWATDGGGWWKIARAAAGGTVRISPCAIPGSGARDVLAFRSGSTTYDLYRLGWRSTALNTYGAGATWVSPMLDAGDRGVDKGWRRVGAAFAAPEWRGNAASADAVSVSLDYSTDGGATWATAATIAPSSPARLYQLEADLPAATRARWLQLRVVWSSVDDWAPVLLEAWADWTVTAPGSPRRRWELSVLAKDTTPRRDGSTHANTGRQTSAALWAAWQAGALVTFRDVDYDDDPTARTVRIVAIAEEVARPADAGRWGESVVKLRLVEA